MKEFFRVRYKWQAVYYHFQVAGNHNDACNLEATVEQMLTNIRTSTISTEGLFLNADAGFDTNGFREFCFANDIIGNVSGSLFFFCPLSNCETVHEKKLSGKFSVTVCLHNCYPCWA